MIPCVRLKNDLILPFLVCLPRFLRTWEVQNHPSYKAAKVTQMSCWKYLSRSSGSNPPELIERNPHHVESTPSICASCLVYRHELSSRQLPICHWTQQARVAIESPPTESQSWNQIGLAPPFPQTNDLQISLTSGRWLPCFSSDLSQSSLIV